MSGKRTKPETPAAPPEPELEHTATAPANGEAKNQPIQIVRIRNLRGAIWRNESGEGQTYYTVTLSRLYKDGDGWRSSASLGRDDLLIAAKVLDQCHTWITFTQQNDDIAF
jgi:hypothetical protein